MRNRIAETVDEGAKMNATIPKIAKNNPKKSSLDHVLIYLSKSSKYVLLYQKNTSTIKIIINFYKNYIFFYFC